MNRSYFIAGFFGILIALAGIVWYAVFYFEARAEILTLRVFDIGQGDAIFLELPDGNQILVDGGPDKAVLSKLGNVMLPWDREIDMLVLTHPHADHLDGLFEVAKRYRIGAVLESGSFYSIPEYKAWHELLERKGVPVIYVSAGERIAGPDGFFMDILAPKESAVNKSFKNIHDAMVVAKLSYGNTSALLMGDAEKKLEYKLLYGGDNIAADILKVGHHGSKTSTSDEFLRAVSSRFALISVGRKNRYGHPHQEVLNRLRKFGVAIFRTDEEGDVVFVSDGVSFYKQQ